MQLIEYPKIYPPFKRSVEKGKKNQLLIGQYSKPEFEVLKDLPWNWTEKVDGTNIRIGWDGHTVTFAGRTEVSIVPDNLSSWINANLPEELFEQEFGDTEVILYGEGCGKGIQTAGKIYSDEQEFVLFDVKVGQWWLNRDGVSKIATSLGLLIAPTVLEGTIQEAIDLVSKGLYSKWDSSQFAEGIVGRVPLGLLSRDRQPLLMKIKRKDFC